MNNNTMAENPPLFRDISTEITLRDLFAACALLGFCSYAGVRTASNDPVSPYCAYMLADLMLETRAQKDGK